MCHSSRPDPSASFDPAQAQALVQYILERFHEPHRRDLAAMLALASSLEGPHGSAAGLVAGLEGFSQALEAHLFKEEMRLFPMMEQGGGSLIGHLIEDMRAEHEAHHARIEGLSRLLADDGPCAQADAAARIQLRALGGKLIADLLEHIHVEDEVLFPMFQHQGAPAAPRAGL